MDPRTQDVIERMGLFFEKEGLPRIAGRVLAYLLLSPEPRTLEQLAEALKVSRSSVSTDARLLERRGTVERVTVPGDRRNYYQIAANLPERMVGIWRERLLGTRELLEAALDTPEAGAGVVGERLRGGVRMMEGLAAAMAEAERVLREGEGWSGDGRKRDVA